MKPVFVDTNILLDVLAKRDPHFENAQKIWELSEMGKIRGFISAISFNNIYYLLRKSHAGRQTRRYLSQLYRVFGLVALDHKIIDQSIDASVCDFEDAIQYYSALNVKAGFLVTRNLRDFPRTHKIAILSPGDFIESMKGSL